MPGHNDTPRWTARLFACLARRLPHLREAAIRPPRQPWALPSPGDALAVRLFDDFEPQGDGNGNGLGATARAIGMS